jgi:uncharacterized membrane protein YbhN (UPF0104 family)
MQLLTSRKTWLVVAVLAAAAGAAGVGRAWLAKGSDVPRELDWRYVILAAALALMVVVVYGVGWWSLVGALDRRRPAFLPTMRLFVFAWAGRYAPASLPYYGGRLIAGGRLGLSRPAIGASLVYENLLVVATAGTISVISLLIGFRDQLQGGAWFMLALLAIGVALVALHPAVGRWVVRRAASRVPRLGALEDYVLPPRALAQSALAYACGSILAGLIFYCSLRASADAHPPLLLAIAAYNIAGIAGMLAFAVPSGLGVREGVVVALLGAVLSPPVALSAAVLARLLTLIADMALPAVVLLLSVGAKAVSVRPRKDVAKEPWAA